MMPLPANGTLLVLSSVGIPFYAARGLTETLAPIDEAAQLVRASDGSLLDLSYDQFRKYRIEITCTDMQAIALDGIWPGRAVTVDCTNELCYVTGSDGEPSREVVEGSEREEGGFQFYRPRIAGRVESLSQQFDEWDANVGWKLVVLEN